MDLLGELGAITDPTSDFLALLHLWNYLKEKEKGLSGSQFHHTCKAE